MNFFHLIACNHALQCDCFWDISTNSIPKGQGWWLWKGLSSANSLQLLFEPWLAAFGGFNRPSWKCNCALFLWISLTVFGISLWLVWSKVQFFGVHSLTAFIFMQSLNSLGQCCLTTKQPFLNEKIFKNEIKTSLLVRETVAPLVVSDERSGKSNLSHAVVNPRPCVGIIRKMAFPSKFPTILGTS